MSLQRNKDGHITADKAGREKERRKVFKGAGKGSTVRPVDPELFDAGWEASFGETEEIRAKALRRWKRLKKERDNELPREL